MREEKLEIDSVNSLVTYCKTVNSPVKMNKKSAGIILDNCKSRDVKLFTDSEGCLYQSGIEGQEIIMTLDDVIDEVCEWNYEDIEAARETLKCTEDYIGRCKVNSLIEKLEKESRTLNFIFYQTKYGRNVEKLADRIAREVMEQLNLVPVYDVPFYDDKVASPKKIREDLAMTANTDVASYHNEDELIEGSEEISDTHIVHSSSKPMVEDEPEHDVRELKGAR